MLNNRQITIRLGSTFAVLLTLTIAVGCVVLVQMDRYNASLQEVQADDWNTLILTEEALKYSSANSRITQQVFLVEDKDQIKALLATRAENSKRIGELLDQVEVHCDTENEKRLLAAIKNARRPYVEGYGLALHLLLDEGNRAEASRIMAQQVTPALFKYHAAYDDMVRLQTDQIDKAAKQRTVEYLRTHRLAFLSIILSVALSGIVALLTMRKAVALNTVHSQETQYLHKKLVGEIDARQSVESALQQSEDRDRLAMDAAKIGYWHWDIVKDEHVWSDTSKRLLGLPPNSPASFQVLKNCVHPDDWAMMWGEINRAIQEKKTYVFEFRTVWPDGSVHWQAARGHAFYDDTGCAIQMTGISMDIDERKLAEERLRLQAEALEAAANAIIITHPNGTILWANHAFSDLTGYTAEEAQGKSLRLLNSGKQDRAFYADLWQTIESGKTWRGEIVNRRKDGSLYTEEQIITGVLSASG